MKNPFSILLSLLFLVAFNGLFFWLVDTANAPASVWISYACIHLAYLTILALPYIGPSGGTDGWFLNATLYTIVVPYFIFQLVVGVAFIIWKPESYTIPLLVQVLMWVGFLAYFLAHAASNKAITDSQRERQQALQPARDMVRDMKMLLAMVHDPEMKRTLNKHYDALYYSGTRQTATSANIDEDLSDAIASLRAHVRSGDESSEQTKKLVTIIGNLIAERKEAVKFGN
ncbi:MAG: hypothetical protein J5486_10520 [Bacteroidaceae bacterium]|nr:hypothetical protein [Bacteroidaceae bacterium]